MQDQTKKEKPYTNVNSLDIEKSPDNLLQQIRDKLSDIRHDLELLEVAYPFMKQNFSFAPSTITSLLISLHHSKEECEKYILQHGHNKFWHDYSNKVDINGKKLEVGQIVKVTKDTNFYGYGTKTIPQNGIYQVHYLCNSRHDVLTLIQPQTEQEKLNEYFSPRFISIAIFRIQDGPNYNLEIVG